jgi:uncharacterized protein DUF4062
MPSDRRIRVMVSSRCRDLTELRKEQVELTVLRRGIKALVTEIAPFDSPFFDCWINEDSPAVEGSADSWEACLRQARRADVVLVLYNGNPGWAGEPGGIGICHAELQVALSSGAAKVFAVELPVCTLPDKPEEASRYTRFRDYFARQNLFVSKAKNGDEVLEAVPAILHEALAELVTLGGREARKGRFDTGDALDWSRLDFEDRKAAMETVVRDALATRKASKTGDGSVYVRVGKADLLFLVHAIPAPMANAAAREMVGRPFHRDYLAASALGPRQGGPVHIFACHRGVTERQAADLLGQPDVVTVDAAFGVLAVDRSSKVQCLFLRNCRDETSTRHAVQRAFDWLQRSGEDELLAQRGGSRARIVKAIAEENP